MYRRASFRYNDDVDPTLLLLAATRSYRTDAFLEAADRLAVPVVVGTDLCHQVEEAFGGQAGQLSLDFRDPDRAAQRIVALAREQPIRGIVATDETTAVIASLAAERLGLSSMGPRRHAGSRTSTHNASRFASMACRFHGSRCTPSRKGPKARPRASRIPAS